MNAWLFLVEVLRLAATIEAMSALRWTHLPASDRLALVRLIVTLPTSRLAAELRALDAAHVEVGDGPNRRPPDGAEVATKALALKAMRALGGGR